MTRTGRTFARSLIAVAACATLAVGCAEIITYSNKSTAEGDRLMANGRVEEAAGAYRNATQQNPRNYEAFYKLGQSYERLGREQQALQAYRTAVDVGPITSMVAEDIAFREKAVAGLANCIAKSASKDAELTAATERANRSGRSIDWYVLARSYEAAGDADNAIDAYDRAMLAANSQDQPIAKRFGLYLVQLGQKSRAEATLQKAYQLDPTDAEVVSALRQIGVVPGPSLLEQEQLHSPIIPKGPLPELELNVKDKNQPATPRQ